MNGHWSLSWLFSVKWSTARGSAGALGGVLVDGPSKQRLVRRVLMVRRVVSGQRACVTVCG